MTEPEGPGKRSWPTRLKRWLITLLMGTLVLTAGWAVLEHFIIDVDRYRPRVEARVQAITGFKATLGPLDLDLFPYVHLTARDGRLTYQDLSFNVDEVTIDPRLGRLIRGDISIERVLLTSPKLAVPRNPEAIREAVKTLLTAIKERKRTGRHVTVDTLIIEDATFYWGGTDPFLKAEATVTDVTQPRLTFEARAVVMGAGPKATLRADGHIQPRGTPLVSGRARLEGLDLHQLVHQSDVPDARVSVVATFQAASAQRISVALAGDIQSASPLAGSIEAKAWWIEDALTLRDVVWQGDGLALRGGFTRHADGQVAVEVAEAKANADGLRSLLALAPAQRLAARPNEGAEALIENLLLSIGGDHDPRFVSGTGRIGALDVVDEADTPIASGVRAQFSVENNSLVLDTFAGDGFDLTGRLEAATTTSGLRTSLSGSIDLAATHLEALMPGDALQGIGGNVTMEQFSAVLAKGEVVDLALSGQVSNGRLSLHTKRLAMDIGDISAQFSTAESVVKAEASGQSAEVGSLRFDGRYEVPERRLVGQASLTPGRVLQAMLAADRAYRLAPVIDALGPAAHEVTVVMPRGSDAVEVQVSRADTPQVTASVTLRPVDDAWQMAAASADARVSADVLAALAGRHVVGEGPVAMNFQKPSGGETFWVSADLTAADVQVGRSLHKTPGTSATLRVDGATAPRWTATTGRLEVAGEGVDFQFAQQGLVVPAFRVALQPLSPLLIDDGAMAGTLSGALATEPLDLRLMLENGAISFPPGVGFDAIDGGVTYRPGEVRVENVRLRGANSAAVFNASLAGGRWSGRFVGEQLDIDAARRLFKVAQKVRGVPEEEEAHEAVTPEEAEATWEGTFDVDFEEVFFREKRFDDVTAHVVHDQAGTHVQNIAFSSHPGMATGTVHLLNAPYQETGTIEAELTLEDFDAAYLDRLLFEKPRGLEGRVDATVRATAPSLDASEAVKGADGTATFTARNGTLGRLGFATQLLSVLRNLEIFQLRMPTFRDEGLVFDECTGEMRMESGVLTIVDSRLKSKVYGMAATGTVDFPRDATNVDIRVDLTEGVTRFAEAVPILGEAVGLVTDVVRLRLLASGSPFAVKIRLHPASRVEGLADRMTGTRPGGSRSGHAPPEEEKPVEPPPAAETPPEGEALQEQILDLSGNVLGTILGD